MKAYGNNYKETKICLVDAYVTITKKQKFVKENVIDKQIWNAR